MDFDINTWRGISTIFVMLAFLWLCLWAYSKKRKQEFEQAANLPFADEVSKQGEQGEFTQKQAESSANMRH